MNGSKGIKIAAIIAFVVGLCILAAGITGKVVMGKMTEEIMSSDFVGSLGDDMPEIGRMLNRGIGRKAVRLTVSLIRNDPSGFVNAVKDLTGAISRMADSSGLVDMFMGSMIEEAALEAFEDARQELAEYAGARLPLLQLAAYYSELLWTGTILAAAAVILWLAGCGVIRFGGAVRRAQPALSTDGGSVDFDEW